MIRFTKILTPTDFSKTADYSKGRPIRPSTAAAQSELYYLVDDPALRANPADDASTIQVATFAGGCFWCMESPFDKWNGQFCDKGNQYRSLIFFHDDDQKQLAKTTKEQVRKELGKRIRTGIVRASTFYPAEKYHQDHYKKNPAKFKFYRYTCGRDARLDAVWGDKARQP